MDTQTWIHKSWVPGTQTYRKKSDMWKKIIINNAGGGGQVVPCGHHYRSGKTSRRHGKKNLYFRIISMFSTAIASELQEMAVAQ